MKKVLFIPTYNESKNIVPLLEEIFKLTISDFSVVVVDDQSPDGTAEIVKELIKKYNNLYLVQRIGIKGRGTAGILGYDFALKLGADQIIEMDSDFSHPPSLIPKLFQELDHADIVVASRLCEGAIDSRPWFRRAITIAANKYARFILESKKHKSKLLDWTTGYRAYRKVVFEKVPPNTMVSEGPSIVQELLYRALNSGCTVTEIPFHMIDRVAGKSSFNQKVARQSLKSIVEFKLNLNQNEPYGYFIDKNEVRPDKKYYELKVQF